MSFMVSYQGVVGSGNTSARRLPTPTMSHDEWVAALAPVDTEHNIWGTHICHPRILPWLRHSLEATEVCPVCRQTFEPSRNRHDSTVARAAESNASSCRKSDGLSLLAPGTLLHASSPTLAR